MTDVFTHPEKKVSEVFFTNSHKKNFGKIHYKSKRLGKTAYDGEGNKLKTEDWLPVFILEEEVKKTGKSISDLRRSWWETLSKKN